MITAFSGAYAIDGLDLYDTYGIIVSKGLGDLLKPWKLKDSAIKKSWADQDGTEYDRAAPKFEEKTVSLEFTLIAKDSADFWVKYDKLIAMLRQSGMRRLYSAEMDRSFYVFYTDCTAITPLTRLKTPAGNRIGIKYSFSFIEPEPSFFERFTFLTNQFGNQITTKTGKKIKITL